MSSSNNKTTLARVAQTKRASGESAPTQTIKGGEKDAYSQANKNYKARYR